MKSAVFFSSNVSAGDADYLCQLLQMVKAGEHSTYLGLPSMLGRNKSATMGFIKDKVRKRMQTWDGKWISQGGREILVKAVTQTLPTYMMSVFLLPLDITKDIERAISKFWWGASSNMKNKIHWMNWSKLCRHKAAGGLGFRDFRDFNMAMLGKQGWKILMNQESLVSQLYKARYFPNNDFFDAPLGDNPSYIWRSIWEARVVIKAGARWKVGRGDKINILDQPWIEDVDNPYVISRDQRLTGMKVASIMQVSGRGWNEEVVQELFNEHDQSRIRGMFLCGSREEDQLYWSKESTGHYSVKSAYRLIQAQKNLWTMEDNDSMWRKIWRTKAPPKVLNFIWRACSNILPTKLVLYQKYVPVDVICPVCNREEESVFHALIKCPVASQCWERVLPDLQGLDSQDFRHWLSLVYADTTKNQQEEIVTLCWAIWKARNALVWNQKYTQVNSLVNSAYQYLGQWKYAQSLSTKTLFQYIVDGDGVQKWVKPQTDIIKVNVDAATFNDHEAFGFGIIARDHTGDLIQAKTKYKLEKVAVEDAEAMAIKEALSWIKEKGWNHVILESDSLVAVQAIRSCISMCSPFGKVVEECREMIKSLNKIDLFFVKRSANMAAHNLARLSCSFPDRVFDRSDIPIEVKNVLASDLS